MKDIAIVYSGAAHAGGIETYLDLLFSRAEEYGLHLTLISLGEWPLTSRVQQKGNSVRMFSGFRIRPQTIFEVSKYLKNNNFDLVVSQGTVANAYARAASFISGVPSLVTVHSDTYFDYTNLMTRAIYQIFDRLTRFQTKRYIAVSKHLKEQLVSEGIAAKRIEVVYNGVNFDSKHKIQNLGIDPQHLVIGSIGRLHKVKNFDQLISACSKLKISNWKLKIIGEGSERSSLEKLIAELGLCDKVELVGNVDDIGEQLCQIDIYAQPSLSEGFGLTVVEAMLAGKPVIVSPRGSLTELVKNDKTGIVMKGTSAEDIFEAISKLVDNRRVALSIASAGQKYAKQTFDTDRWARETTHAYNEAAK